MLSDERFRAIARKLVETVRGNVTIDCTLRENVCGQRRVLVRSIPRKNGYPPGKRGKATQTVLEQAEVYSETLDSVRSKGPVDCEVLSGVSLHMGS